jgi:antitoxin FitA
MSNACDNVQRMTMIQIRNVREETHRKLKVRAAQAGTTLSDYLREEIERLAELPTPEEMEERLRSLRPDHLSEPPHALLRRLRDAEE